MSRRIKEDEVDIDEATEEAKEAESEQVETVKKAEADSFSAKTVRDIIFPEIGDKGLKAAFSDEYKNYINMSDEDIVLAYREFYKNSMAKKAAPKKEVYEDPALKAPIAETKEEAPVAAAPVVDETALKKQYMKSVYENIDKVTCATESEKSDFIKSLNIEALSADDVGELITSVESKLTAYHTANAEAEKKAAKIVPQQSVKIHTKTLWEKDEKIGGMSLYRYTYDEYGYQIGNKVKCNHLADKPVKSVRPAVATKPQQVIAPATKVAATPTMTTKPTESKSQKSFISGGKKIVINADGTVSVQAERKPITPTQKVLMTLRGGAQLVLMNTYVGHGGRLAEGKDYTIPNKGQVKVEAVEGGFNETVVWTDGGTKTSFYPAVKVVGIKLSDRVIKMTQVPEDITDEDLAKICKAIGSVLGQKLSDQTLGDIANAIGEEKAWSFAKPYVTNK